MQWAEVVANPALRDLPFKIELNEYGAIVMNPVKPGHSFYQGEISFLLRTMRSDGRALAECAISTRKGTKVADVAWVSLARAEVIQNETEASVAPEVCVEVVSMSNSSHEMKAKKKLYFEQGAQEVWVCDEYGYMTFHNPDGKLARSEMFPDFPQRVELPLTGRHS
jgi:Uma2 family endonuclease